MVSSNTVSWKARTRIEFHPSVQGIVLFLVIMLGLFLCAAPALAAGGGCPTGNTTVDPNGNPISLSSLGIASCFYVSKSTGSDTNNGTSESTPWAHLPGMPSCTGNCASTTPAAGEGFILRGGESWTSSDLPIAWTWSGTGSNPFYIGVDPSWYNSSTCGAAWCRPILNEGRGNSDIFGLSNESYIIIDRPEVKGFTNQGTVINAQGSGTNIRVTGLYAHGWSWASGGNNTGIFRDGGAGTIADHFIIDGSDSTQNTENGFFGSWSQIQYGYISYVVSGVLGSVDIVHDVELTNKITSVDGDHCNSIFGFSPLTSNGEIYYNLLLHGGNSCSGGVVLWFNGNGGTGNFVNYGFNNIIYNESSNPVNIGNHGAGNYGTYYWFNNTVDCTVGGCGGAPPTGPFFTVYDQNNHVIPSALNFDSSPSGGRTPVCNNGKGTGCTDLTQSESVANGQGYTASETYSYSPISSCTPSTCGTVQHGTDVQSWCTALSAINATAGAACQSSTSDACTYNTTNHTLSCPNNALNARTSAWDIGSYEYGTQDAPPNPPTGLSAVVN
jgi:hypothetical protein